MTAAENNTEFGRVAADGTVYVRDGENEHAVGQFAHGTPAEALDFYTRRFADFENQVALLETRIAKGTAGTEVTKAVEKLAAQLATPTMVGDLQALRERISKLETAAQDFISQYQAQREAAREKAYAQRSEIVAQAEQIAAQVTGQINWRTSSQTLSELFDKWQQLQREGVYLPKPQADQLWQRFKQARNSFEAARRKHFAQLAVKNDEIAAAKEKLIAQAEKLAEKGAAAVGEYRKLLDSWKAQGHGNRKTAQAQWERFKAAGDVIYAANKEQLAVLDQELSANFTAKQELLDTLAPAILEADCHKQARKLLTQLQTKWDQIGHVPRAQVREVEDQLTAVEAHVRALEEAHWQATDPEPQARSAGLRAQLTESITKLESEIAQAVDAKKAELEQKLATQKAWLAAIND